MLKKSSKILSLCSAVFCYTLIMANISFAKVDSLLGIQELAEYKASDLKEQDHDQPSVDNHDRAEFYFKNQKYIIEGQFQSDNSLLLSTTKLSTDFKTKTTINTKLDNIKIGNEYNYFSIKNNNNVLFLSTHSSSKDENEKSSYQTNHFVSRDGETWHDFKIENFELEYLGNITDEIITAHVKQKNGEYYDFKQIYSVDNGYTWSELKFLNGEKYKSYSVVSSHNNTLFVSSSDYKDGQSINTYYTVDLSEQGLLLNKINVPNSVTVQKNGVDRELNLSWFDTFQVGDYLFADSWYFTSYDVNTDSETPEHKYASKDKILVSKDGGLNWEFINLDFDKQTVDAMGKSADGHYYVVTSTDIYGDEDSDADSVESGSYDEWVLKHLSESKVSIYKLSEEKLFSEDKSDLEPSVVLNKALSNNDLEDYAKHGVLEISFLENETHMMGFYKFN